MFKLKNIMVALVVFCLTLLAVPTIYASSTQFDNSDFVSEISSEEQAEIDQEKREEDYDNYQEQLELRDDFKNFSTIIFYEDADAFQAELKDVYDSMEGNGTYSAEQKNDYYNAVIGSDVEPGVMYQIYEINSLMKSYNENEDVVVDCSEALAIIQSYGSPKLTIDNIEYINQLNQMLIDISASFKEVNLNTASSEEIQLAKESNVLFASNYKSILSQFEYLSLPKDGIFDRLLHTTVIMNIAFLIGTILLFVLRFPIIKKQQEYAWNQFKPLTLLVVPIVSLVFFIFFSWFFNPRYSVESPTYATYIDGVPVSGSERIYQNEEGSYHVSLIANGGDLSVSSTSFDVIVTSDPNIIASQGSLPTYQYGDIGVVEYATNGQNSYVLPYSEDQYQYDTIGNIINNMEVTVTDDYEPDELALGYYIDYNRNEFILPIAVRLVFPSIFFGTLFFMFILMPKAMVKTYLNELYTINKFCGFLSYNMAYRSNARVLIEETLQSLEACKFAEDFAIIFFEKERNMTDKIQDISQIYSYKFFEMYLGIVNIIFDEGVSDSTLKSLSIIQQFGDEYYNQADMFFKSKNGAISSLLMIIAICVAIPVIVKTQAADMFSVYLNTGDGYTGTLVSYLIWYGLVCIIFNMYKNNKIVRAEGRYV